MSSPRRDELSDSSPNRNLGVVAGGSSPRQARGDQLSSSPAMVGSPRSVSSTVPRTPSAATPSRTPRTPNRTPQYAQTPLSATPARGDVGRRNPRFVSTTPHSDRDPRAPASSSMGGSEDLVWGTSINTTKSQDAFVKFWTEFKDPITGEPLYPRLLKEALEEGIKNINLNCRFLHQFDPKLYQNLVRYPQEIIPLFDLVIDNQKQELAPKEMDRIQVRPFNLLESSNMRALNPNNLDTLISIKGMVTRASNIIPDVKQAFFECSACAFAMQVPVDEGVIAEPTVCANCSKRRTMNIIHNRGLYADKQVVKLQETPDDIPQGETPHTVSVFVYDNLVDVVKPGDRVEITGVYRAVSVRVTPTQRTIRTVYHTHIDAIHVKKTDGKRLEAEDSRAAPDSEFYTSFEESDLLKSAIQDREKRLQEMAKDPDIYKRLTQALAPSTYEMDDVKKGLLCMLFGGANEEGAASGRFRGNINVLMCGDPGTAKSQLLQYVHKIAPRGIYTSGKGSSAVGLTATVSKDPVTGDHVLESGALVLSDRGVCCIDEFDKMSDATRSILHEVMEQQTVSIAKAGIVCTLNARTSILASANPKESRYNPHLALPKNILLGPTLLSRFDLIYLILDTPTDHKDRRLAMHIIRLYDQNPPELPRDYIPVEDLTAYISYARKHIQPRITNEAEEEVVDLYLELRAADEGKGISATPRNLESMIRLSEALARMQFRENVTREDVREAYRLVQVATQAAATDPTTGRIDMSLASGAAADADIDEVTKDLKAFLGKNRGKMSRKRLFEKFNQDREDRLSMEHYNIALKVLQQEQAITINDQGVVKLV